MLNKPILLLSMKTVFAALIFQDWYATIQM